MDRDAMLKTLAAHPDEVVKQGVRAYHEQRNHMTDSASKDYLHDYADLCDEQNRWDELVANWCVAVAIVLMVGWAVS